MQKKTFKNRTYSVCENWLLKVKKICVTIFYSVTNFCCRLTHLLLVYLVSRVKKLVRENHSFCCQLSFIIQLCSSTLPWRYRHSSGVWISAFHKSPSMHSVSRISSVPRRKWTVWWNWRVKNSHDCCRRGDASLVFSASLHYMRVLINKFWEKYRRSWLTN